MSQMRKRRKAAGKRDCLFKKLMALPSMSCYELDEPNHRAEKSLAWMEPYLADLRNPLRYHESHWAMQNLSDIQSRAKKEC